MNNEKIKELSNIIRDARKYSLIGEYGYSLEKYQEAVGIIKERQKEIINESEDLNEKWKMTEYNIKSEMLQIKDILETCLQLHHSHFNYKKKQLEANEDINENKKKLEKEIMEIFNKDRRIYDNNLNDDNKNNLRPNKSNKIRNKTNKPNMNLMIDNKKNRTTTKMSPWVSNKNPFNNNKFNKTNKNDINSNLNIKKCKSLKTNNMEKKMFNPLEEFYGLKVDNKIDNTNNINKEQKINGKDNSSLYRRSEVIQQKINLQKILPSSINLKPNIKKDSNKNLQNKISYSNNDENDNKKYVKVVEIDLNDNEENRKINNNISGIKFDDKNEENVDMVEQALKNLSQLNIDNNDDSF